MNEKEKAIILRGLHTLLVDVIGSDAEYVTSEDLEAAELYERLRGPVEPGYYDGMHPGFGYVAAIRKMLAKVNA
jgi:hypothetical protein